MKKIDKAELAKAEVAGGCCKVPCCPQNGGSSGGGASPHRSGPL